MAIIVSGISNIYTKKAQTEFDETGSKLSDISDVPQYTGNANKVLIVNQTEDGIEYKQIIDDTNITTDTTFSSNKIANITNVFLNFAKIYASYLSKQTKLNNFIIVEPSDISGATIETNLVKVDASSTLTFSVDITNISNSIPTQIAFNIIPGANSNITIEYSFDGTTFTSYTVENVITNSTLSSSLYIKITNTSTTLPFYFYGIVIVTN